MIEITDSKIVIRGFIRETAWCGSEDSLFVRGCCDYTGALYHAVLEQRVKSSDCAAIKYWISENAVDDKTIRKECHKSIMGNMHIKYYQSYRKSSGYIYTTEILNTGECGVMEEIRSYAGKYLLLEINYVKKEK